MVLSEHVHIITGGKSSSTLSMTESEKYENAQTSTQTFEYGVQHGSVLEPISFINCIDPIGLLKYRNVCRISMLDIERTI